MKIVDKAKMKMRWREDDENVEELPAAAAAAAVSSVIN